MVAVGFLKFLLYVLLSYTLNPKEHTLCVNPYTMDLGLDTGSVNAI